MHAPDAEEAVGLLDRYKRVRAEEKRKKKRAKEEGPMTADDFEELDDIGDVGDALEREIAEENERKRKR